ncbi:NAD-binding protein [Natrarchaeobius chitinivorans]|uniref:Potassium channel protein n=1 Tax=Natrarchaeobius chitinivorans TaxID=1679083 RepID=A0A3N6MJN0_NATCH|nr:NAD-binding protein [Natrarchaeobius chitinivorans]RQG97340.1 potassium channel protein [Natrarchaeobius chitinivorans]
MATDSSETGSKTALEELFYHTDGVRFIYWRQFTGARPAVYLTALVAVAAFVTGLSHLSRDVVLLEGPLAPVLPISEGSASIAGVVVAFLLVALTFGLIRRKRVAWYCIIVAVPLSAVVPLATLQSTDLPLLLLILVTFPLLVRNRHQFDRRLDLSAIQIASLSSIVGVLLYGTVGSYAIRDQFVTIDTWGDAVYYVIVTIATVGYGDITPVTSQAKWFSLSVILLGTGAFTAVLGSFIVPAIEKRMAAAVGTMSPDLTLHEDHVLVLGYGTIAAAMIETLDDVDVVVVTAEADTASSLNGTNVDVVADDPASTSTLQAANIDAARGVVVATEDDARDVLAIVAAKQANPDVRIVAAANEQRHADKLEAVGADDVVSPTLIAGKLLGESVLER